MNRDATYVNQILDAIDRIEKYTENGKKEFMMTQLIQDAVIRNLEVIGEISKRISDGFRAFHYEVPWRKMAGIQQWVRL